MEEQPSKRKAKIGFECSEKVDVEYHVYIAMVARIQRNATDVAPTAKLHQCREGHSEVLEDEGSQQEKKLTRVDQYTL